MTGIGFHEAREMWVPKLIDILNEKEGETPVDPATLPIWYPRTEGDYPRTLSRLQITGETKYDVCIPPDCTYAFLKGSANMVYLRFYDTNGRGSIYTVGSTFPRTFTYGDRVVVITNDDSGPTEKGYRYYHRFGLDRVEIPVDCPRLTAVMPRAVQLFNTRYAYRMLNSETLEEWQVRLQHTADINVYRYERALELYATNASEMSNVLEKTVTVRDYESKNSGSDSTTYGRKDTYAGTVKNVDTPDSAVNATDDYADSITRNNNTNTASGTDTLTHGMKNEIDDTVTETREPEGGIIRAVNDSIDAYRDIVVDFVKEFENNFLNVFWY